MPDRSEGGFNWIAGTDALPMLCREVEECHELGPVLLQAQRRLGVFWFIGFDEQIERLLRILFGLGLPDVVDRGLGLWLRQFGKAIQHVHRFVLPAPLVTGLGVNLIHGRPEAHGTVPDGQFWGTHSPALEAEKDLAPALGGLAHPVFNRQEPFLATGRNANNYKGAELIILAPKAAMDAISPDIDDWFIVKICISPAVVFVGPIAPTA